MWHVALHHPRGVERADGVKYRLGEPLAVDPQRRHGRAPKLDKAQLKLDRAVRVEHLRHGAAELGGGRAKLRVQAKPQVKGILQVHLARGGLAVADPVKVGHNEAHLV